jgi:broad specificity phosphatase PhoE/uncharacterized coiled-coil protein SlyX
MNALPASGRAPARIEARQPALTLRRRPRPRPAVAPCRADGGSNGGGSNGGGGQPATTATATTTTTPPSPTLDELASLVQEQRALIAQQRRELERLAEQMAATTRRLEQQQQPPPAANPPIWGPGAGPDAPALSPSPFEAQRAAAAALIPDRRARGLFDARFHSTRHGATPPNDYRALPPRIVLIRHAESEGNIDRNVYARTPDPLVPLTAHGREQARRAGLRLRSILERATLDEHARKASAARRAGRPPPPPPDPSSFRVFFFASPYKRALQTYEGLRLAFAPSQVQGFQEEVHLREQDFGGQLQVASKKEQEKEARLRYGRFWFRFEGGESGADVFDRMSLFVDRLTRDVNAGRFAAGVEGGGGGGGGGGGNGGGPNNSSSNNSSNNGETSLVLVTHGLALRVFLMRWFGWSVDEVLRVFNPPNATPIVLERVDALPGDDDGAAGGAPWIHTQALYRLSPESLDVLRGCTPAMAVNQLLSSESEESEGEEEEGAEGAEEGGETALGGAFDSGDATGDDSGGDASADDDDGSGAQDGSPRPPYNDFFYGPF